MLLKGERLERKALADRLKIKLATVDRYLAEIRAELPLMVTEQGKRCFYALERTGFGRELTLAEALAATFGAAFAGVFQGTQYEDELRDLRSRLIAHQSEVQQRQFGNVERKLLVLSQQAELLGGRDEDFDTVLDCVLKQRPFRANYESFDGEPGQLTLRPYSLVIAAGHVYVLASEPSKDFHTYRFVRLHQIEALSETFPYPPLKVYNPSKIFRHSFGIFFDLPPKKVRLRFGKRWASFLRTHRWHHSQKVATAPGDAVLVTLKVGICPELQRWVLGFGEDVEVLAPKTLRDNVRQASRRLHQIYSPIEKQMR
jgi:predicted DNA-binding transcriptional regulator YafY